MKYNFKEMLLESVNDKYLYKAVFLAGGPGSGKSFITGQMFDGTGAVILNSDAQFEYLLKKNELPFDINPAKVRMYKKQMDQRAKAKKMTAEKREHWLDGMLPIIIDGTGKDFDDIKEQGDALKKLGYDISMVFVNTSLDIALQRNSDRKRSVPEDLVKTAWQAVQNNMGKFQNYFGAENFIVVDNNDRLEGKELQDLGTDLYRKGMKLIQSPLKNPVGLFFIDALKSHGLKYVSEIIPILSEIEKGKAS